MSKSEDASQESGASFGVEALIERLRDEGVASGRSRAQALVADAETRAKWLVEQAEEEAERVLEKARREVERLNTAAREALKVAARDALLDLKAELSHGFAREVERLVSAELKDKEVLKQLILAVASRAREEADQAQQLEILLPRHAFGLEELRHNPDELAEGELTKLVHAVVEDRLRDGVRFAVATDDAAGIRVRLVDHDIILDLSDQTVAHLLLEHLQPRFRALLEGVVK